MERTERGLRDLIFNTQSDFKAFPGARDQISKMEQAWNFLNPVVGDEKFDDENLMIKFECFLESNCKQMDRKVASFRRTFMRFFSLLH
jgi:hypothetical protein